MTTRAEGPNWLQRRLIQREIALRNPSVDISKPKDQDPLAAAKLRYHQIYAEDIGLPLEVLSSAPIHVDTLKMIDSSVESVVLTAEHSCDLMRTQALQLASGSIPEDELFQFMSRLTSANSRGCEQNLELISHWLASPDIPEPKWKRRLRRLNPFSKNKLDYQDLIDRANRDSKNEMDQIARDWENDMRRRYRS